MTDTDRTFDSPRSALLWHDRARSKRVLGAYLRWFAIGFFIFAAALAPPFGAWLGMSIVLWLVVASLAASSMIEPTVWGCRSSLPDYLLASPISVNTLAWSRLRNAFVSSTKMSGVIFACTLLGFFAVDYQEHALEGWGLSSADSLKAGLSPNDTTRLLVRSLTAIGLTMVTLLVTFIPSTVAATASGRNSVGVVFSIVYIGGLMILCGVGLRWFLSHSDWESVQKDLALIPDWLPLVATVGLSVKALVIVATAAVGIFRHDLEPKRALILFAGWAGLVVCVGYSVGWLAPHRWITPVRSVVTFAMLVPLAGVWLTPTMVRWNLHR